MSAHVVVGENISQTYQFVATGAADLGFVARSSLIGKNQPEYWLVPETLHAPIRQDAVALTAEGEHPDAAAFVDFLSSDEGVELIRNAGYDAP
jgi:molybdate transport system substrate-binding protein